MSAELTLRLSTEYGNADESVRCGISEIPHCGSILQFSWEIRIVTKTEISKQIVHIVKDTHSSEFRKLS